MLGASERVDADGHPGGQHDGECECSKLRQRRPKIELAVPDEGVGLRP